MAKQLELSARELRAIFEGTFGQDRLSAVVRHTGPDDEHEGGLRVVGEVRTPEGQVVGEFDRRLYFTEEEELEAFSHGLEIQPVYRGRGFSSEFNRQVERPTVKSGSGASG